MFRATSRLRFIEPQLASLVDQPPEGRHWIHEVKHDGYRCIVIVERGGALVYTRNGYDWSDRYPSIVRAASLTSNASQRSLMVRLLSRTLMDFRFRGLQSASGRGRKTSSSTPSIFSILMVTT